MKLIKYVLISIALLLVYNIGKTKAQVSPSTVSFLAVPSTALAVNCPTPTTGYTIYCEAYDKYQVSTNGAAYVVIWPVSPTITGVTSITVNGGTAQTGPVALTIPSKVILNPITPTGVIQ